MAKYLVTGRAASGKSAVTEELQRRGITVFDTDAITGLSGWRNIKTDEPVLVDDNTYVDLDTLAWVWNKKVLFDFIREKDNLFICCGADNDFDFEAYFDEHFVLAVTPTTQISRLRSRSKNDYGKDFRMFPMIIEKQRVHVENAKLHNAIIINAEQPIKAVVDTIMSHLQ